MCINRQPLSEFPEEKHKNKFACRTSVVALVLDSDKTLCHVSTDTTTRSTLYKDRVFHISFTFHVLIFSSRRVTESFVRTFLSRRVSEGLVTMKTGRFAFTCFVFMLSFAKRGETFDQGYELLYKSNSQEVDRLPVSFQKPLPAWLLGTYVSILTLISYGQPFWQKSTLLHTC